MPTQAAGMNKCYHPASELWEFEEKLRQNSEKHYGLSNGNEKPAIVLGVDGGATTTISICLSCAPHQNDPVVLARAVTGSSNFNSVSGLFRFFFC